MNNQPFSNLVSKYIWETKYRQAGVAPSSIESSIYDTWRRVAQALATLESEPQLWTEQFYSLFEGFKFIPGGRILAGAGVSQHVTLFNCFVMGTIPDDMGGIFDALKQGALTMQQGGGVGYDFSTLRPAGTSAQHVGGIASGPISFMRIWDSMCATLLSTGNRRGAMMATLRCDHPDIEAFIAAKQDSKELRNFNLSVLITDDFMRAVGEDADWPLVFPAMAPLDQNDARQTILRAWSGSAESVPCRVVRTLRARDLWRRLMQAAYAYAEPGVLFIDRINETNNLAYFEKISATNPCGEIPLPPYGACDLGSINLTQFIRGAFSEKPVIDFDSLKECTATAVRLLDNVIDLSRFPLEEQQRQAHLTRRIGLGITGLADLLAMCNLEYGSDASLKLVEDIMCLIRDTAYHTSVDLAVEKGPFPAFVAESYTQGVFIRQLPIELRQRIRLHGIRNSHLLAIAPAGTISLLANNVSSGLEPIFETSFERRMLDAKGEYQTFQVNDYAYDLAQNMSIENPVFSLAQEVAPHQHLAMQALLQRYVDNAISKTINVSAELPFDKFVSIYDDAYVLGLKGCTVFRPNSITGNLLQKTGVQSNVAIQCCTLDREAD